MDLVDLVDEVDRINHVHLVHFVHLVHRGPGSDFLISAGFWAGFWEMGLARFD